MSKIKVQVTGNGSGYVSNPDPPNATEFTIFAYPAENEHLIDMYAMSEDMGSVAIGTEFVQTLIYNDEWGGLTIYITFSGETPPEPPEPPIQYRLAWLLAKAAGRWRINGKY